MSDTLNSTSVKGTNVQVAVRCRPVNAEEKKSGQGSVVTCDQDNKAVKVSYGPAGKKLQKNYTFDKVFGMYSRQQEIFDSMVRPIVDEVLDGFNCTIFAYGQTGTGKTHTMEGNINCNDDAGIVPRSVKTILEKLESSGSEFTIRVSFLELYNEELQDLLVPSSDKKLKLCEDAKKGVVCQNLEEITVLNANDIFDILARGIQQRQTAATLCNKNSSRSHSIFTMKIMIKECNVEGEEVVRHGQLNLVDLAGSECVGRSGAKNDRAREAGSINQSLLTLGRVITALVDHHGHIPYRDSKLTRLLQESLGGKAKTCIIATLSPSAGAIEETMSTLDYAYRAKSIKNQPVVNQRMTKKVIMKEYLAEVELLRSQLIATREKNGVYLDPQVFYDMESKIAAQESQLQECESALAVREEEIKKVISERDDLLVDVEKVTTERDLIIVELDQTKNNLDRAKQQVSASYIELKGAEAIIGEHMDTEQSLLTHGTALKDDLRYCQSDVNKLLGKVSMLRDSEAQKICDTQNFVDRLCTDAQSLVSHVQAMSKHSQQQSESLGGGVNLILEHGRATCGTLQQAIDSALTVMVGDAENTRDSMVNSCENLKKHLGGTNQHLASTLQSLQGQLSEWLSEVATALEQSQDHLLAQKKQIEETSVALENHFEQVNCITRDFMKMQNLNRDEADEQARTLHNELQQQFINYEKRLSSQTNDAAQQLQNKAQAIEKTLKSMLTDMVSESVAALQTTAGDGQKMCTEATQRLTNAVNGIKTSNSKILDRCSGFTDQVCKLGASTSNKQRDYLTIVENQRSSADSAVEQVTKNVGEKRKFLDSTVTTLVADVDGAIVQATGVVNETATNAHTVLTSVSAASKNMNETVRESMTTFTSYMDKEGEELSDALGKHFNCITKHFESQTQQLTVLKESSTEHEAKITSSALKPSGSTPQKIAPSEVFERPLKRSRAAAEIADETRSDLKSNDKVTYDFASAELEAHYFNSNSYSIGTTHSSVVPIVSEEMVEVVSEDPSMSEDKSEELSKSSSESTLSKESDATIESADTSENFDPNEMDTENAKVPFKKSASASRLPRTSSKPKVTGNGTRKTRSSVLTESL